MKTYRFSLVVLLCLMAIRALAQECVVSGQIFDSETKETIPGVPVIVKGTTKGITTDVDGIFRIKTSIGAFLIVKNVGYETIEILVTEKLVAQSKTKPIAILLKLNSKIIEDVAVTGYFKVKKPNATDAMDIIDSKTISSKTSNGIDQVLQGRAGVTVISNSSPGSDAQVYMRGLGTINNSDPLYILDGMPQQSAPRINPLDIKSVTILKDASACAIYGSRGANGVVVITTKGGEIKNKISDKTYQFRSNKTYKATLFVVDSLIIDTIFDFDSLGLKKRNIDEFYLEKQKNGLSYVFMDTKMEFNNNLKNIQTNIKEWILNNPHCLFVVNNNIQTSKLAFIQLVNSHNITKITTLEKNEAEKKYGEHGKFGIVEFTID